MLDASGKCLIPRHIEILIQRVKKLAPEEIAQGIKEFDPVVCTQVFLSELKRVVPTPEQVILDTILFAS
jgi:cytokinesis protein